MHGILCVNPADPFQFHGLRRQHQEQVGCLLIVSSYTWPKGSEMSQMGMRKYHKDQGVGHVFVHDELRLINISVFSGLTLKRSNHFEVQVFCAPSRSPRYEPEGLAATRSS